MCLADFALDLLIVRIYLQYQFQKTSSNICQTEKNTTAPTKFLSC